MTGKSVSSRLFGVATFKEFVMKMLTVYREIVGHFSDPIFETVQEEVE